MCGFAGLFSGAEAQFDELQVIVTRMSEAITHRGPDDAGAWADEHAGIALGHRRLSIVDLSAAGQQPMHSAGGRFVLAFNGEIYNHLNLRAELEAMSAGARSPHPCPLPPAVDGAMWGNGHMAWRGHSDTETLLAGFEAWGIEWVELKKLFAR